MKKYLVTTKFRDKFSKKTFRIGDVYESDDAERIEFLQGKGFVETAEAKSNKANVDSNDDAYPKHTGGGWYELSNGEKVQGKDEAAVAEEDLKNLGE